MSRRRVLPSAAKYQPGPVYEKTDMWVDKHHNQLSFLTLHALWQQAPLDESIRKVMRRKECFLLFEVRLMKGGPPVALLWHPLYWERREGENYVVLDGKDGPVVEYTPYNHYVCFTADKVWTSGGGMRPDTALTMLVHALDDTSWVGEPGLDFYRRPFPETPMSEDDAAAVEGLG